MAAAKPEDCATLDYHPSLVNQRRLKILKLTYASELKPSSNISIKDRTDRTQISDTNKNRDKK